MLFVPNILWASRKPEGYSAAGESRILVVLERIGEALVTCFALIFKDFNPSGFSPWSLWLIASFAVMLMYELWWIRYFRGPRRLEAFYRSMCRIPVPGASLPVAAFLLLGVYGQVLWMILAAAILGVGHIGIHLGHSKAL